MRHLDQADATGTLDIGGKTSDTPYHLKAIRENDGYRVEISLSAPRDWLLQRGFEKEAVLRRENGAAIRVAAEKRVDVDGPISIVLTSRREPCASAQDMIEKYPELKN